MAERKVLSVGFAFPGGEVESLGLDSNRSVLDADVIVFEPDIPRSYFGYSEPDYRGRPVLSANGSFQAVERAKRWRSELVEALKSGKTVIVFLAAPEDVYVHTGEKQYSGTGRNARVTNTVVPFSSYQSLPISFDNVVPLSGHEIKQTTDTRFIAAYWQQFGNASKYEVYVEGEFSRITLTTKTASKTVGAIKVGKQGALVLLPPLRYDEKSLTKSNGEYWSVKGEQFGAKLLHAILEIDTMLRGERQATPAPPWVNGAEFRLGAESRTEGEIKRISDRMQKLQTDRQHLELSLVEEGGLRRLVYEKGRELEGAVLDALRLLGFEAQTVRESDSEFDVVFSSAEGRFLGEVEGKDSKPVNIDKLSQLERNIQEDFARENTQEYAKGVLFANAHRLVPPTERDEWFTAKCLSGAKRSGVALVRTTDLFSAARYSKESADIEFAAGCRRAIRDGAGGIVQFPTIPSTGTEDVAEAE